jgi:hypothetical protein
MPDAVGWRRAVVVFHDCGFDELQLDLEKSRKAVSQRRSSPKGSFSLAEDALKRRMT